MTTYYFALAKKYVVVRQHGPLSLYSSELENHQLQGWNSISWRMGFGRIILTCCLDLHGHGSWSMHTVVRSW